MKRSEMIKIIGNDIESLTTLPNETSTQIAKILLDRIEYIGMQPPSRPVQIGGGSPWHEWEPEDV